MDDTKLELYAPRGNNTPLEYILYRELYALHSGENYFTGEKGKNKKIVACLAYNFLYPKRLAVLEYIEEKKAVTELELLEETGITQSTVSRALNAFRRQKIIRKVGKVLSPYVHKGRRGPKFIVWALWDAGYEDLVRAQKYVAETLRDQAVTNNKPVEAVKVLDVELHGNEVVAFIGAWDQRITTIHEAMNELKTPSELRGHVKEWVISYYSELRRKELKGVQ
jgi:DNA-binding transcriptional ArsR family regulator